MIKDQKNIKSFKPAWWLSNAHLQTIWPHFFKRNKNTSSKTQRLELSDGDFIDITWFQSSFVHKKSPIVVLLHGTGGNDSAHYLHSLVPLLIKKKWRIALINFRGCSEPNRVIHNYHAGDTKDIEFFIRYIKKNKPDIKIFIVGYSLGGNNLLKWLGESKKDDLVNSAIAVAPPLLLKNAVNKLDSGLSKIYQWWLLRRVKYLHLEKNKLVHYPIKNEIILSLSSFKEYNEKIVIPLQGYNSSEEYYQKESCLQYLKDIGVPTLIIKAKDDPFIGYEEIIQDIILPDNLQLEIIEKGGHLGFVAGNIPFFPEYWLEKRIVKFLENFSD